MTRPKAARKKRREMTAAMRQKLARRMHITEDELESRILEFELDRLDAETTSIYDLFGELDPLDPYIRTHELQAAQEYVEEAIYQTDNHAIRQAAIWQYTALGFQFNSHIPPYDELLRTIKGNPWSLTVDGDPRAFRCYTRHYTFDPTKRRTNGLFVGPGHKLVLIIPDKDDPNDAAAVFGWRLERYRDDPQYGANCCLFHHDRDRTGMKGSDLILAAEDWARLTWPFIPRLFTHIDPFKVAPYHDRKTGEYIFGRAYRLAGWFDAGFTTNGLITLARNFVPLGASHPWFPRRRKEIRPPYWPLEKQVASMPPWAGGMPAHMRDGDERIIQRATIIANKLVSPLRQISHPL